MAEFLFAPTPNKEAVDFIASKPALSRAVFDRLLPELKARAFTIAGIEAADVLQSARELIATLPAGGDWNEIKSGLVEKLSPYFIDPGADEEEQAKQANAAARRAELLIRTHGQQAYATAQYSMLDEQRDLFPYWQYLSLGDGHVRKTHAALDGIVLPADHEFWKTHYPPWEWGCRCQCVPLTRGDVEEMQAADKAMPKDNQRVLDEAAQAELTRTRRLVRNGVVHNVTAPREQEKPGAFHFDPGNLRISTEALRARYDGPVFASFEKWARSQNIDGTNVSVFDWLEGATFAAGAPEKIYAIEKNIAAVTGIEHASIVDAAGKILIEKSGTIDQVTFSVAQLQQMSGATLTHNHPSGESLSAKDVRLAIVGNLAEIRAVGELPDGRRMSYSLIAPQGGWRASVAEPLIVEYRRLDAAVFAEFSKRIESGALTLDQAAAEHAHEVMSRLAAKYPKVIHYERSTF